jgi:hypothetical protein
VADSQFMSPEIDFTLTEEHFKSFKQLLAGQGVEVRPMARETVEDLEKGGTSHVSTSGIAVFCQREFVYHIFPETNGYRLTIDAFTHDRSTGEALAAAIGRVFPQEDRGVLPGPAPARKLNVNEIGNCLGCIGVLLFILALFFFAALGVRSLFK